MFTFFLGGLLYIFKLVVLLLAFYFVVRYFFLGHNVSDIFPWLRNFHWQKSEPKSIEPTENLSPEDQKKHEEFMSDKVKKYLYLTDKISLDSTPREIQLEEEKLGDEMTERKFHKELKEVQKAAQDGPVKIEFDNAMFLLRHYNRHNVISEDGQVHLAPINLNRSNENVFVKFDQAEMDNVMRNKKIKSQTLLEDLDNDMPHNVTCNPDGSKTFLQPNGDQVTIADFKIASVVSGQNKKNNSATNEIIKQQSIDKETSRATSENRSEIAIDIEPEEKNKTASQKVLEIEKKLEINEEQQKSMFALMRETQYKISRNNDSNEISYLIAELEKEKQEKQKISNEKRILIDTVNIDELTRAYTQKKFREDFLEVTSSISNVAISFFDLDKFKSVNDTYGHDAGDLVLVKAINNVFTHIGKDENVNIYRIKADEFVIIFLDKKPNEIFEILEQIRVEQENTIVEDINKKEIKVTSSFGVSFLLEDETKENFLTRAEKVVYNAKHSGRNKIAVSEFNKNEVKLFEECQENNLYK